MDLLISSTTDNMLPDLLIRKVAPSFYYIPIFFLFFGDFFNYLHLYKGHVQIDLLDKNTVF